MQAILPRNRTVLVNDFTNVVVSVPLGDADNRRRALPRRALRAHGGHPVVALVAEPRDAEARADAEDADAVLAELPAPVEHEHAQRRLGAAVADRLKGHRLGPAGGHGASVSCERPARKRMRGSGEGSSSGTKCQVTTCAPGTLVS